MAGIELYAPRLASHRRTWTAAAIPLVIVFTLSSIIAYLILKYSGLRAFIPKGSWQEMTYELVCAFGVTIVVIFAWVKFFERRSLATIGLNGDFLPRYARGFILGLLFITACIGAIYALGGYQIEAQGGVLHLTSAILIPSAFLLLGFVIQGASEEIMMRGWFFQLVTSRHGVILGIFLNMLIFSLLHAGNIKPSLELFIGLFNIVLIAIFFSLYALKEGSLWGVCAWHSAWNWLLGIGYGLEVSGLKIKVTPLLIDLKDKAGAPIWLTGGTFGPEASLITSVIIGLGIVYFALAKGHGTVFSVPEAQDLGAQDKT